MAGTVSTSGSLSVGGLASGLDTNSLIDGLVKVEMQRVTTETQKQSDYQLKLNTFNDLDSKLGDMSTQAKALDDVTAFNLFKSTSSDDTVAQIDGTTDSSPGNYDVKVLGLASTQKVASKSFSSQVAALGLSGSFKISVSQAALTADPTTTSVQVDITANDTLKDVMGKINRASGSGAGASILQMGANDYRLMLTASDEGTKAFTLDPVSGSTVLSSGLDLVTGQKSTHSDFNFRLNDGGPATASTTFDQVFQGIGQSYKTGDVINWTAKDTSGAAQNGSFTIDLANPAANSVGDLINAMQAQFSAAPNPATASLNASGEVTLTDNAPGGANDFQLSMDVNGTALGGASANTDFKNTISGGQNAFYLLNDLSVSSQSNTDASTVVGTQIHLKKVDATQDVKLTLDRDPDKIIAKVQSFLDAYNTVIKFIDDNTKVSVQDKNTSSTLNQLQNTNSSSNQAPQKGPFTGDSSILGLKQQLQNLVSGRIDQLTQQGLSQYSSFASIGITTSETDGTLSINQDSFKKAINVDMEGVRRLFVTGGYSNNADIEYGTSTADTHTGVYNVNTTTNQIDTKSDASSVVYASGNLTGDNNILNSSTGDSKGLAVSFTAGTTGQVTFIRGVAGQVKLWTDQLDDYVNGFATNTKKSLNDRIQAEQKQIDLLQSRADTYRQRLVDQFSQLELSISHLQSQSAAFQNSGIK